MQNYKFMMVEIEEDTGDLKPGYYFSTLTPKEAWEKLQEVEERRKKAGSNPLRQALPAKPVKA
jgi:hypothetical protein